MYILFALPIIVASFALGIVCLVLGCRKLGVCSLVVSVLLNVLTQSVPLNLPLAFGSCSQAATEDVHLRVLEYNMHSTGSYIVCNTDSLRAWLQMVDSVQPDIMCLAEIEHDSAQVRRLDDSLKVRYPYSMWNVIGNRANGFIDNVYSKYPILEVVRSVDTDSVLWHYLDEVGAFADKTVSNNLLTFRLLMDVNNIPVNLIHCHLYSNNYGAARKRHVDDSISWIKGLGEYVDLTQIGYAARALEAAMMRDTIAQYEGPTLVCGDFNDLSGSIVLRTIMGKRLQNAWWAAGHGIGFTFDSYHLLLRLDHILFSKEFDCTHCEVLDQYDFSDHKPLVADFTLRIAS